MLYLKGYNVMKKAPSAQLLYCIYKDKHQKQLMQEYSLWLRTGKIFLFVHTTFFTVAFKKTLVVVEECQFTITFFRTGIVTIN
jgi:hypothetical protein